jgi:selenide, water dikinase
VQLYEGVAVEEVQAGRLRGSDGLWYAADATLWCTQASAAPWLARTGLAVGEGMHTMIA